MSGMGLAFGIIATIASIQTIQTLLAAISDARELRRNGINGDLKAYAENAVSTESIRLAKQMICVLAVWLAALNYPQPGLWMVVSILTSGMSMASQAV